VKDLEGKVAKQDEEISKLQVELNEANKEVCELKKQVDSLEEECETLWEENKAAVEMIATLNAALEELKVVEKEASVLLKSVEPFGGLKKLTTNLII